MYKVPKEKIKRSEEIFKKLNTFKTELTPSDLIEIEKINEEILDNDQKVKQFLTLRYPQKVQPIAFKIEMLFRQRELIEHKDSRERAASVAELEGLTLPVISDFNIELATEANKVRKLKDYKIVNKVYNGKKDNYSFTIKSNFPAIDKAIATLSEGRVKLQSMSLRPLSEIIQIHDETLESVEETYPLTDTIEGGEDILQTYREMRAGGIAEPIYEFKSPAFLMNQGRK